jgi:flagellar basal body-associated protein FliL
MAREFIMSEKAEKKEPEKGKGEKAGKHGGEKAAGGGLLSKTPVLLGIAMLLQAVVLFAGFKLLGGGPKKASGVETAAVTDGDAKADGDKSADGHGGDAHGSDAKPADGHGDDAHGSGDAHGEGGGDHAAPATHRDKKTVELKVVEFRAPNKQSGRMFLYDVAICISVRGPMEDRAKSVLADNDARVKDRIRTIIAQSPPEKLAEPGLETLRRQVKYQLDQILGENVIDEVFVPRCIPFPVD